LTSFGCAQEDESDRIMEKAEDEVRLTAKDVFGYVNILRSATAMGLKRTFADDSEMRGIAMEILANCSGEPLIIRQVQAVMSSNEDVLAKADALKKLLALKVECPQAPTKFTRRARPNATLQQAMRDLTREPNSGVAPQA
jgi:hypothetical protein